MWGHLGARRRQLRHRDEVLVPRPAAGARGRAPAEPRLELERPRHGELRRPRRQLRRRSSQANSEPGSPYAGMFALAAPLPAAGRPDRADRPVRRRRAAARSTSFMSALGRRGCRATTAQRVPQAAGPAMPAAADQQRSACPGSTRPRRLNGIRRQPARQVQVRVHDRSRSRTARSRSMWDALGNPSNPNPQALLQVDSYGCADQRRGVGRDRGAAALVDHEAAVPDVLGRRERTTPPTSRGSATSTSGMYGADGPLPDGVDGRLLRQLSRLGPRPLAGALLPGRAIRACSRSRRAGIPATSSTTPVDRAAVARPRVPSRMAAAEPARLPRQLGRAAAAGGRRRTPIRVRGAFTAACPATGRARSPTRPGVAAHLGLERLAVKMEVERFGLPAFKMLGASWAVCRALSARAGRAEPAATFDELRALAAAQAEVTLVTATDGNHGRAVAHVASLLGLAARILVPAGTAAARIEAIAGEGARVEVVRGSYDEAVALAAEAADDSHLVISDTSWPGYEDVPGWVADGYATIFEELAEQLPELAAARGRADRRRRAGVGGGARARRAATRARRRRARRRGVRASPPCATARRCSSRARTARSWPGLNCGLASRVALPDMAGGIAAFCAIDDRAVEEAVRLLLADGLACGETGASGVAGPDRAARALAAATRGSASACPRSRPRWRSAPRPRPTRRRSRASPAAERRRVEYSTACVNIRHASARTAQAAVRARRGEVRDEQRGEPGDRGDDEDRRPRADRVGDEVRGDERGEVDDDERGRARDRRPCGASARRTSPRPRRARRRRAGARPSPARRRTPRRASRTPPATSSPLARARSTSAVTAGDVIRRKRTTQTTATTAARNAIPMPKLVNSASRKPTTATTPATPPTTTSW